VSTYEYESCILDIPVLKAWKILKTFKCEKIAPNKVKSTEFLQGAPGQIDSVIRVTFKDDATWELRLQEVSELRRTLAYEVLSTEPPHKVTSIQGEITLRPITNENKTFVEWKSHFSNDADVQVIEDQRFKKFEFFEDIKNTLCAENKNI